MPSWNLNIHLFDPENFVRNSKPTSEEIVLKIDFSISVNLEEFLLGYNHKISHALNYLSKIMESYINLKTLIFLF